MSSPDLRELLSKPADSFERPPALPAGTYHGVITHFEYDKSKGAKQTPLVRYFIVLNGPGEDIDPADLAGIDLAARQQRVDFYLTEGAMFRLREFLESIKVNLSGRAMSECIPEAINAQVNVHIVQQNSQRNPEEVYNVIQQILGAD